MIRSLIENGENLVKGSAFCGGNSFLGILKIDSVAMRYLQDIKAGGHFQKSYKFLICLKINVLK
jgi:hypothetical protein